MLLVLSVAAFFKLFRAVNSSTERAKSPVYAYRVHIHAPIVPAKVKLEPKEKKTLDKKRTKSKKKNKQTNKQKKTEAAWVSRGHLSCVTAPSLVLG